MQIAPEPDHAHPDRAFRTLAGTRQPLGIGVGGLAVLASLGPTEAEAVIDRNAQTYRRFGGMTANQMLQRVDQARRPGFAQQETNYFTPAIPLAGIAFVVPASAGERQMAISATAPATRFPLARRQEVIPSVMTAAGKLARAIGSVSPGSTSQGGERRAGTRRAGTAPSAVLTAHR